MPSRSSQDPKEPQMHSENKGTEEGERTTSNRNKRDREDPAVRTPTAVSPEPKKGSIVSYMSGNAPPATPRRGEGKKKNRSTESMDDDADEKEIQQNLDAMRKAAAAAEQTIKEMGITAERDTDLNNKAASTPTQKEVTPTKHANPTSKPETRPKLNKNPPEDSKNEEDNSNSSSETSSQKRSYTEKKPKEKQKKKRKTSKRSRRRSKAIYSKQDQMGEHNSQDLHQE